MTTINNSIYSNSYYSLNQAKTSADEAPTAKSTTLVNASTQTSTLADAYTLDLSEEAKNYLQKITSQYQSAGFTLTKDQTESVNEILQQYKDEPFTQETFERMQDDLEKAGLSPERLSALDRAQSFNATEILMKALNGDFSDSLATSDSDQKTKADNYVKGIIEAWSKISTTIGEDGEVAPVTNS